MKISIILKQIIQILFLILLFLLPLVNSRGLYFVWLEFDNPVDGNFEFSKVIFFNIYTSLLLFFGIIYLYFNKFKILLNKNICIYLILFYFLFIITSFFSIDPYLSVFWDTNKWHNLIMFNNLVGIFLLLNLIIDKKFISNVINILIFSWILLSIIWLKEYFSPSYDYWLLTNRGISTFGHPNYLSIYILTVIILLIGKINFKNKLYLLPWILLIILSLITTKSYISIFLFFLYTIYLVLIKLNINGKKNILYLIYSLLIILFLFLIYLYIPEKLSSLISRFYIWETTIIIIIDNIKTFFLWWWFETLWLVFDKFKVIELYIYENIWYTADRPHNLLLNFFYSIWFFWFIFISYLYYFVIKNLKNNPINISLLIIFIFLFFNFASIATYLLIIILFWILLYKRSIVSLKYNLNYLFIIIFFISLIWWYYSFRLYISEIYSYRWEYIKSIEFYNYNYKYNYFLKDMNFISNVGEKYHFKDYYLYKIRNNLDLDENCINYTSNYSTPEAFFYCWNLYWYNNDKKNAYIYYNKWLSLLPDLRNKNSKYFNSIFFKTIIWWNRFLSDRYWLKIVLERLNKSIN